MGFWVIKILSTTVGETAADYLSVNAGWGPRASAAVMTALLALALCLQLHADRFSPWRYWLSVVLVSIVGTQLTDGLTDGLGVSLVVSTIVFAIALAVVFLAWYRMEKTLAISSIVTRRREAFYWLAILLTFALGTAAGDLCTEAMGMGFRLGALLFGLLIGVTMLAWRLGLHPVLAFWVAYIFTRPLGASLGDWLTQARQYGGLGLGAMMTSIIFLSIITVLVGASQRAVNKLNAIERM